jgi:hypothetical protein
MPAYPCLRCAHPFVGEARNVYLTVYRGDERAAFRYIVCPACEEALIEDWLTRALHRSADGDWELPTEGQELMSVWLPTEVAQNGPQNLQGARRRR